LISTELDDEDPDFVRRILLRNGKFRSQATYLLSASATENLERLVAVESCLSGAVTWPKDVVPRLIVRIDDPLHNEDWRRQRASSARVRWRSMR
jgi:hypothetical protein